MALPMWVQHGTPLQIPHESLMGCPCRTHINTHLGPMWVLYFLLAGKVAHSKKDLSYSFIYSDSAYLVILKPAMKELVSVWESRGRSGLLNSCICPVQGISYLYIACDNFSFEGWSQDWSKSDGCFSQYLICLPWSHYEDNNISLYIYIVWAMAPKFALFTKGSKLPPKQGFQKYVWVTTVLHSTLDLQAEQNFQQTTFWNILLIGSDNRRPRIV